MTDLHTAWLDSYYFVNTGPERENGTRMEADVLMEEAIMYKKQLGIDAYSLGILAKTLNKEAT
ncbi:hypothetical protein DPMN_013043 [Dreissena polymorpha]|uniref:Uncharacterized protein n=1 Tax=Dreissena polymorpha TaxID=45954 RepID=A0A9D4N3K1_DREPO|nr:hypothetical protein DPMN_013043 [Dreissena polymorpha]